MCWCQYILIYHFIMFLNMLTILLIKPTTYVARLCSPPCISRKAKDPLCLDISTLTTHTPPTDYHHTPSQSVIMLLPLFTVNIVFRLWYIFITEYNEQILYSYIYIVLC